MEEYYWDSKIDYLSKTRGLYYNDDYIEFLVKSVWKINIPVHIIDFGCGYDYLGLKLLPILPKNSKYTGIDAGVQLINRAKEIFKDLPYQTEFVVGDIQKIHLDRKYDIAICHAFLLHMTNPQEVLKKMIDCVVDKGRIICFEPHWISNMSNYHINGHDQSSLIRLGLLQKLFEADAHLEGKDGNIGIKLPVYLSQLGIKNIECRVSDKVNFLDPNSDLENLNELFNSLSEDGFGAVPNERETFISNLVDRGANHEEARKQYENELFLSKIFKNNIFLTNAPNMKITFGNVERS
ncbi:MAG: class I SAM-dependent methyltransferase [Bacillota bacterium]